MDRGRRRGGYEKKQEIARVEEDIVRDKDILGQCDRERRQDREVEKKEDDKKDPDPLGLLLLDFEKSERQGLSCPETQVRHGDGAVGLFRFEIGLRVEPTEQVDEKVIGKDLLFGPVGCDQVIVKLPGEADSVLG